jgi:hypothetical protein
LVIIAFIFISTSFNQLSAILIYYTRELMD